MIKNISKLPVVFQIKCKFPCSWLTHLTCLPYQTLFLSFINKLLQDGQAKPTVPGIPLPISPGSLWIFLFYFIPCRKEKNLCITISSYFSIFTRLHAISVEGFWIKPLCTELVYLYALRSICFQFAFYSCVVWKSYSIFVCPSGFNNLFEAR